MNKDKKNIIVAVAAFWIIFAIILTTHVLTGTAVLRTDFSISRYVGLTVISALAFFIGNVIVSVAIGRYIKKVILKNINQPTEAKIYAILVGVIIATLMGVSIFPCGLFDNSLTEYGTVTIIHQLLARTMFVAMFALAFYNIYLSTKKPVFSKLTRNISIIFAIIGTICFVSFMFFPDIFWSLNIIYESTYIAFFMVMLLATEANKK
jgi:hypothetical protein